MEGAALAEPSSVDSESALDVFRHLASVRRTGRAQGHAAAVPARPAAKAKDSDKDTDAPSLSDSKQTEAARPAPAEGHELVASLRAVAQRPAVEDMLDRAAADWDEFSVFALRDAVRAGAAAAQPW
jgi:hypothetical protein